ncbi:GEVED domain-containing protein [Adhaeribacter soli]|uniref:PKD domain-containing protein n=1 Tax=Adhaeribacter soli TaxID=2607655 RepID=A0A5N1IP59_9BACT|nr:GEVED domain-containing protein [Adhaeribacter soli]KAA9325697.1 PKD domain-containing protein [Adhaeribacter soli]
MKQKLQVRFFYLLSGILFLLLFPVLKGFAQCPVASSCTPGNLPAGSIVFGMGILNVNLNNGAINNTTPGVSASTGYTDYACTIGATLTANLTYPVSIQTNGNVNENAGVWVDLNNNGTFEAAAELVFSSTNKMLHTGTITLPATAVTGTPLRMRVSADNFSAPVPTPCSTPQYSEVEDYSITIISNTAAPVAAFTADSITCTSTVAFTDLSQNGPTAWRWNFGDPASGTANTSTLKNPVHTFSGPGTYTITLAVTNAIGSDTLTKTNYLTYHTNVPVAAACTPGTTNFCCGYGITNVDFGSGLLVNASANGAAGYQDFTCSKSVTVTAGNTYPVALTSGINPQDTRIYIDLNNDGNFSGASEMVLQLLNMVNPAGNILIPGTAVTNTPLRMRIISDEIGSTFTGCNGIISGQAEDYTIIIQPNQNLPVADFCSSFSASCDTVVAFTDQSTNGPGSWLWNFGDPASGALNTSTLQHPTHIYHNTGTYTVTLTATNGNGSSTVVKTNLITVVKPCQTACTATSNGIQVVWITNVKLNNLNKTSGAAPTGYSDFTGSSAVLIPGQSTTLSVSRGGNLNYTSVSAWIDYNRNGNFETTERVMTVDYTNTVATAVITVPSTIALGYCRMRIVTDSYLTATSNPCFTSRLQTETEDYTINFQTDQQPPLADFTVSTQTICSGPVTFTDNSINGPTTWLWNFGDPASGAANTSTLQNPIHIYSSPGQYTVTLTVTNANGSRTLVQPNFINYDPNHSFCTTVVMPAKGTGLTATRCSGAIFDPGGPIGQYPDDANGTLTIAPTGAATVTLTFTAFNLESGNDLLRIYDGPDTSFPLIGTYSGNTLPNGGSITSTRSALTLSFTSNNRTVMDGFQASWSCTAPGLKPAADFLPDLSSICTGSVSFHDRSSNAPTSWLWDFGDPASGAANTSTLQNPVHTYPAGTAGAYTVTLITCNSIGCDTLVKTNYINIATPCLTYCASSNHRNAIQWISNVTAGTINNTSAAELNGYGNYTYLRTDLIQGNPLNPVSVTLGDLSGISRYVTVWIDFNQDGIFQITERVLSTPAPASGPGGQFMATGNFTVPANARLGTTRMRIIMNAFAGLSNPCQMNLSLGETEDYTVNILPSTFPTVAGFSADLNTVCTGTVQFTDASANGPTSWLWNFGDPASGAANTSTLQNPTHMYSTTSPGNYTVTLTACKGGQCNTVTKTNYVTIPVPCLTYCASANNNNSAMWISWVKIGTIDNTTSAELNGYGNYTYLRTNLTAGAASTRLQVSANTSSLFIGAWIDFNQDGIFQSTEQVMSDRASATGTPPNTAQIYFTVPATALAGITRMRIIGTTTTYPTNPCATNLSSGETEDYTINIISNPPVANFSGTPLVSCTGLVNFTDASTNTPTSWLWNFGDPGSGAANTSTLQHPSHTFSAPGTYSVTLTATNGGGSNTVSKTNYITVNPAPVVNAGATETVCSNAAQFQLTGFSPAGGTWSGPGVSTSGLFTPTNSLAGNQTLTYTVNQNGCSTSATKTITVNAAPVVSAGTAQAICAAAVPFQLTGFSPAGGTWSGAGVGASGLFTPATSIIGNQTLTYTVSQNGCTTSATKIISVTAVPVASTGPAQTVCANAAPLQLTGFSPTGGSWSGPGVSASGLFTPTNSLIGNQTLTYTVTQYGCTVSANQVITVTPAPVVNAGANDTVCADAAPFQLAGFSPAGGTWSGPGVSATGIFTPATSLAGNQTLTYTYTGNGCTVTATRQVTVSPLPMRPAITLLTPDTLISSVSGSGYEWTLNATTLPTNTRKLKATATGTYAVRVIDGSNCTSAFSQDYSFMVSGIKEASMGEINLYPNPSTGIVNLVLKGQPTAQVTVFNSIGSAVLSKTVPENDNKEAVQLNLSGVAKGIYLIRIKTENKVLIRKVVME